MDYVTSSRTFFLPAVLHLIKPSPRRVLVAWLLKWKMQVGGGTVFDTNQKVLVISKILIVVMQNKL